MTKNINKAQESNDREHQQSPRKHNHAPPYCTSPSSFSTCPTCNWLNLAMCWCSRGDCSSFFPYTMLQHTLQGVRTLYSGGIFEALLQQLSLTQTNFNIVHVQNLQVQSIGNLGLNASSETYTKQSSSIYNQPVEVFRRIYYLINHS